MENSELFLQIFITCPCKFVITIDLIQTQRLASFIVLLLFKYFCLICILFSCQIRSTIKIPGMSGTVRILVDFIMFSAPLDIAAPWPWCWLPIVLLQHLHNSRPWYHWVESDMRQIKCCLYLGWYLHILLGKVQLHGRGQWAGCSEPLSILCRLWGWVAAVMWGLVTVTRQIAS